MAEIGKNIYINGTGYELFQGNFYDGGGEYVDQYQKYWTFAPNVINGVKTRAEEIEERRREILRIERSYRRCGMCALRKTCTNLSDNLHVMYNDEENSTPIGLAFDKQGAEAGCQRLD